MCESSAPAAPSDKTTQTVELPEWARGYAKNALAKGAALTDINQNPYQQYNANRIAEFSPMQEQAQQGAANMQSSQQLGTASDMAQAAGIGALGANYLAGQFSNQFQAPGQYQPGQFSMSEAQAPNLQNYQFQGAPRDVRARNMNAAQLGYVPENPAAQFSGPSAIGYDEVRTGPYNAPSMREAQTGYNPNLQNYQMGPAERVNTQSFAQPGSAEAYMSPYMQNVVDIQKREAQRQSGIQGTQQQAQAAQAGAFGGSRDAIMRAERERNLSQQMGDIQAQGSQAAFGQAQQQFNAEQQARLQAQQANQQAGLTVGGQNLAANLGVQQLGAGQIGLQTSLANLNNQQQAAVQNQAAQLQTQGMNAQQALQAALANQQAGINTGQFNATNEYNTALQNAQMRQQAGLSTQALRGQYGLQQGQFQQAANAQNEQQRLQAALANQQTRYNVGAQNLAANLGVQQLGSGQNMQAQLANQQALQQAQNAAEQSRQFGSGQGLQAANLAAQYGQSAQQLGEQSRQYGAGLGMQGLQTALQSAGQLGQLGGQQFQQGMDINKLQSAYGGQQQQQAQRYLDQNYQDFLNQQNYPYKQLGFMSDMVRGLPLGQQSTQTMYQAPGSMIGQLGGLGMGALGMSSLYNSATRAADGGLMDSYAGGGDVKSYAGNKSSVTSQDNKDKLVNDTYSIEALMQAKEAALARRDVDTANAIDERIAQLNAIQAQSASIDRGLGSAFDQIPEERQETMMAANGGIVAFADRGAVVDPNELTPEDYNLPSLGSIRDFFTPKAALENRRKYEQGKAEEDALKAKPTMTNRPQPKGAGARSTPSFIAKDMQEEKPAPKQKKLNLTTDKAITKMAEEQGIPKEDFMDMYDKVRGKLQNESKEDLKGLQDLIDKQSGKSKEIKEQALGKALAEFGFNMAAQASKKGREGYGQGFAGLLGSASAASPILAASAAESQKLANAADDNDMKLQMEMRKFNIATRKNDSATAMSAAQNMRILQQQQETIQQQQRQLNETIRANKAKEGLLGQQIAAKSGTSGLRGMQYVARSRAEAMKLAQKEVDSKIKGGMGLVKPEDYDRMLNQAMKRYLPITTGFGMTGMSSSKDDDDIIDLD